MLVKKLKIRLLRHSFKQNTSNKNDFVLKERKKERIFNVHEAKNSLWDRLLLYLTLVFGPFPVKFYNEHSQLIDKLFAE